MTLLPNSLFGRAAAILLGIFLLAQGAAMYAVWKTVVSPLSERSADDLAARMVLAAQTWVELPPETRSDYEIELFLKHNLELGKVDKPLATRLPPSAFGDLLEHALSRRTGQAVQLKQGPDPAWAWVEVTLAGNMLRVGYLRDSYELDAPWEAGAVFLAGALLTLAAALFLARRTAARLRLLARSAAEVGQGRLPQRLPETGATELRDLTAAFNRMADEVQALLENRTVLLSGISHDLRTPITRMQLALAMLDDSDPAMVARMEDDLREMTRLIAQMLDFARSLKGEGETEVPLDRALAEMAASCSHPEQVRVRASVPCSRRLSVAALNRVVGNLVENALRYGGNQAVELELACDASGAVVRVLDRGPGIPPAEREKVFQPFYRLEESRSRDTGGSGLGLAIVRQLADAQGWRVELADRPGGGLCASVLLDRV
ncbi:HAMP domain-containing protein [Parasulfuritortus cantonensis]|uniref:histidine kinase n=1 Tax=Parasulfuritortus cantonensis TaxID=2528202 RepID=A0A4V2NW73_9PROT|nr:ATP-binding protein [Parasulfuritortus cantonensis]TCJ16342.1 HAMP domain-containing protein [Parasulfuritortus cantonensis]